MIEQDPEHTCWFRFNAVKKCREALLRTGGSDPVEASLVDRNWGIGLVGNEGQERRGKGFDEGKRSVEKGGKRKTF